MHRIHLRSLVKLLSISACLLLLAGCGDDKQRPAAACGDGPAPVLAALRKAPGPVTLAGRPLSRCLTDGSNADDVQLVGAAWVQAAGRLADGAAGRPNRRDALRLGYLVGAAELGASRTPGIHSELVRRLEQEAEPFVDHSRALARGRRAGRRLG
jgi:hypothetical protein